MLSCFKRHRTLVLRLGGEMYHLNMLTCLKSRLGLFMFVWQLEISQVVSKDALLSFGDSWDYISCPTILWCLTRQLALIWASFKQKTRPNMPNCFNRHLNLCARPKLVPNMLSCLLRHEKQIWDRKHFKLLFLSYLVSSDILFFHEIFKGQNTYF